MDENEQIAALQAKIEAMLKVAARGHVPDDVYQAMSLIRDSAGTDVLDAVGLSIAAEAWDQGYDDGRSDGENPHPWRIKNTPNPYKKNTPNPYNEESK